MLGTGEQEVRLWSLSSARPFSTISFPNPPINDMCFSYDGESVFVASDCPTLSQINLYSGERSTFDTNSPKINRIACSKDGIYVATGSKTGPMAIFSEGGAQVFRSHKVCINALTFSNSGSTLIVGDKHGVISTGITKRTRLPGWSATRYGGVLGFSMSHHSETLGIACKAGFAVYDLEHGKIRMTPKIKARIVRYSPFNENLIAIATRSSELVFFDPTANSVVGSVPFSTPLSAVDFRFDGVAVAAASGDGVKVLDIRQLGQRIEKIGEPVTCLEFQPRVVTRPICNDIITMQTEQPRFEAVPPPIVKVEVQTDTNEVKREDDEEEENDEMLVERIRQEIETIGHDIANEPTLSPRNAAFLKAARELRSVPKGDPLAFVALDVSPVDVKSAATERREDETFSETREIARIICEAWENTIEDVQDELDTAMNNVHLDVLQKIEELKRQLADM